jgi:enoyl-CoA hydratase/carnithine racemase
MAELEYECGSDGVATILLNRPERRNAFTRGMLALWRDALLEAAADDQVRAVVLRAAGESFCSGIDLDELEQVAPTALAQTRFITEHVQPVPKAAAALDKPLIACVRGAAVGAGMDMALACDMRFADASARFRESYVHIGLVPGAGGAWFLPRVVGFSKAFELLVGGETVDAEEALRIGLVNRLYPDEAELLDAVYAFAGALGRGARPGGEPGRDPSHHHR